LRLELAASETTEMDPVALPPVVGANTVPKVKLCPAVKVRGKLNPVIRKPVPETLARLTVTVLFPVLVKVSDKVLVLVTGTVEKSRLESLALNAPAPATVAVRGIAMLLLDALLAIEILPVADPLDCGVKVTLNALVCPAASVTGRLSPFSVKPVPARVA
jgi:hypothetical protein